MLGLSPEFWLQIVTLLLGGGAIYGGIRADLKGIHVRVKEVSEIATRAHDRIDSLVDRRR